MSKEELTRLIKQTVAEEVRKNAASRNDTVVDVRKQLAAIASNDAARTAASTATTQPLTASDVQSIATFVAESPTTTEAERQKIASTLIGAQHARGPQTAVRTFTKRRTPNPFWD